MEGLQTLKPHAQKCIDAAVLPVNGIKETADTSAGIDLEVRMVISEDTVDHEMVEWAVENVKFSVKQPVMGFFKLITVSSRKIFCIMTLLSP